VLGQAQLVTGRLPAGPLDPNRAEERFQGQVARLHVGANLEAAGPDLLRRIILLRPRLREPERAAEAGENRQGEGEVGPKGLAGIREREYAVLIADLLGDRIQQRPAAVDQARLGEAIAGLAAEGEAGAHRVVELAVGGLTLRVAERLAQQQILIGVLLGEATPSGPERQGREEIG